MTNNNLATISLNTTPVFAIAVLAFVFIFGLFIVGYDQGHVFSIIQGEEAFIDQFLHEFSHDLRHAAGFPCH